MQPPQVALSLIWKVNRISQLLLSRKFWCMDIQAVAMDCQVGENEPWNG